MPIHSIRATIAVFGLFLAMGGAFGQPSTPETAKAGVAYIIAPADSVTVAVVDQPDLNFQARVDGDGQIDFPHLGRVKLATLTQTQAAAAIASGLKKARLVVNPQVIVTVTGFGQQVSVLGQVGTAGVYPIDRELRITDILARAGGIRTDAAASYIVVLSTGPDGKPAKQQIDTEKLLTGADPSLNQLVSNGETIYVPPAPVYYLSGFVNKPGAYPMLHLPLTVEQAILAGGGVRDTGAEGRVRIRRTDDKGVTQDFRANLDDKVQANDTLIVPESWF
jgi:polysaccharide export outer membrane protein